MIQLHNKDCLNAMLEMADNQFDLAIVDPPFGIGNFVQTTGNYRDGKKHIKKKVQWNKNTPTKKYFDELKRVSKNQIIWGANYFNCFSKKHGAIIWIKNQPMPDFSKAVIASVTMHKKIEIYEQTWTNFVAKGRCTKHPCEMPVALYKWILQNYAKSGDSILDTHLGSGSIAIACHDMGFDLTAYEIDAEYFAAAQHRLKQHQRQLKLF